MSEWLGELCHDCGRRYRVVYRVPNEVWAAIAPGKASLGAYPEHMLGGLLCVDCADERARERGIYLYFEASAGDWRVKLERKP